MQQRAGDSQGTIGFSHRIDSDITHSFRSEASARDFQKSLKEAEVYRARAMQPPRPVAPWIGQANTKELELQPPDSDIFFWKNKGENPEGASEEALAAEEAKSVSNEFDMLSQER
eukprot:scaffold301_cov243-Pinguiococcus_pyrenoidosus.AAC.96